MTALHQVRAVALTDYSQVARSVGLDPESMLESAGIDPSTLGNPEFRLPASDVAGLLDESALVSGCDAFGIMMAKRRSFESLGPIVPFLRRQGTVREVVTATNVGRRRLNDVFRLGIDDAGFIEVLVLPQFGGAQATDQTVAMTHVLLTGASCRTWRPTRVQFSHPAPRHRRVFDDFFGAPVDFGARSNGFACAREALDHRWSGEPAVAAEQLVRQLEVELTELSGADPDSPTVEELMDILAKIRSETGMSPTSG